MKILKHFHPTQPNPSHVLENSTKPNLTQHMDGPNPCPSLTQNNCCDVERPQVAMHRKFATAIFSSCTWNSIWR